MRDNSQHNPLISATISHELHAIRNIFPTLSPTVQLSLEIGCTYSKVRGVNFIQKTHHLFVKIITKHWTPCVPSLGEKFYVRGMRRKICCQWRKKKIVRFFVVLLLSEIFMWNIRSIDSINLTESHFMQDSGRVLNNNKFLRVQGRFKVFFSSIFSCTTCANFALIFIPPSNVY